MNEALLNNLYYYYIPTNNNKLFSLLSVIETSFVGDKILLMAKKKEEVDELTNFFKTKGILTAGLSAAVDFETPLDQAIDLYITTEDFIEQAKSLAVTCVVSISCSLSVEECRKKAAICARPEKQILIELIAKSDFSFVQSLYKFEHVEVNRFASIEKETIEKNKDSRTARFIQASLASVFSVDPLFEREKNLLENLLLAASAEQIKKLYVDLLARTVYACFPKMNELVVFPSFKIPKECRLELNKGEVDGITAEKIQHYFGGIENFLSQYILDLHISQDKTIITLNLRELNLEKITHFVSENLFDGTLQLEAKALDLKNNKFGEGREARSDDESFDKESSSKFEGSRDERRSSWRSSSDRSYGRSDSRGGDRGGSRFGDKRRFGSREFGSRDKEFGGERSERSDRGDRGERNDRGGDRYSKPYGDRGGDRGGFKRFGSRSNEGGGGYDSYKSRDRDYKKPFSGSGEKSFYKKEEFSKEGNDGAFPERERSFSRDSFYRKNDQKFERGGDYQPRRRREFQPRRDEGSFFMKRDSEFSKFSKPKKSRYGSRDDVKEFDDYAGDEKTLV